MAGARGNEKGRTSWKDHLREKRVREFIDATCDQVFGLAGRAFRARKSRHATIEKLLLPGQIVFAHVHRHRCIFPLLPTMREARKVRVNW